MVSILDLIGVLFVGSVIPSLYYLWRVRRLRWPDRSFLPLLLPFLWGLLGATTLALIFNTGIGLILILLGLDAAFLGAVIVAPLVEEPAKALGNFLTFRKVLEKEEDGIVIGSAVGLGFAAVENVLYSLSGFYDGGASLALTVLILRSISSTFFHMVASAIVGWGMAVKRISGEGRWVIFLLTGIVLHMIFNFIAVQASIWLTLGLFLATWAAYWGLGRFRVDS